MRTLATTFLFALMITGCNSNKPQQPTAEQQKQMQKSSQQTDKEMRQLTSGEGNSMLNDGSRSQSPKKSPQKKAAPSQKQQSGVSPQH